MDAWYYATADGQRHGPLPAEQLRALASAGTITRQTLVWCEGQAQWRPLQDFATELELEAFPPPLPGAARLPPAPRPGMSGCLIAVLVAAVLLFLVAILGILAAIAVPAYNDYRVRATSSAAIVEAQAHQDTVTDFMRAHDGRCPRNEEDGFGSAESYAGTHLAAIEFGEFEGTDLCGLEATIRAPGQSGLDGSAIWLEYDPASDHWECTSEVEDPKLPPFCRG